MNKLNHNNYYCLIAAGGLKCKMFPKKIHYEGVLYRS